MKHENVHAHIDKVSLSRGAKSKIAFYDENLLELIKSISKGDESCPAKEVSTFQNGT